VKIKSGILVCQTFQWKQFLVAGAMKREKIFKMFLEKETVARAFWFLTTMDMILRSGHNLPLLSLS
jgi:hypothetical protein